MKLVSVIIPTYNRAEMLCQCVDSVLDSTYTSLEILIVDNNSSDNTVELIKSKYCDEQRVKLFPLKRNMMAAGGRNEGIKHAKGDYLLFVDNDNVVFPDMIEKLIDQMERDKQIGLVGPLSVDQENTIWLASGDYNFFTSRPVTLYSGRKIDDVKMEERYVTCYSPNIMMVSRDAIEAVGGFDQSYYAMYEEADFGYRILKSGYKSYIITGARTTHMGYVAEGEQKELRNLGINFPERAYHYAKNRSVFIKKYAKWYQKIVFFTIFIHVFTFYYCFVALKNKRIDIAAAWFRGTIKGMFTKVYPKIKVKA